MSLFKRLVTALRSGSVSPDEWDQIRANLITSDLGVKLVDEVIEKAKSAKPDDAKAAIAQIASSWLSDKSRNIPEKSDRVNTVLIVGVNGTGKTTSVAKLANRLSSKGNTVLLAAADTFRAAATDQLQTWAARIGIEVVTGEVNSDPASVAFSAISRATESNYNYLLVDTAGRLHTKQNLMDELGKIKRVIQKVIPGAPHEVMLVLDGSTGQNALEQAKQFTATTEVTALSITKLDGTAKGGVVLAIANQFKIPVKYIGVGEKMDDLIIFDKHEFVDSLFKGVTNG
jgi:fused signal recognition particle receptor